MSDISSFCTMGGMMTMNNNDMHKIYKHQYTTDMQVILPDDHNMHNDIGIESDSASGGPLEPGIPHNQIHDNHNASSNHIHNTSTSNNINHDDMNNHQTDHSHQHNMSDMNMNSGGGTIMYMDGFHSALFHNQSPPPPCLNLFSSSWTLHSESKFLFAMVFITLLGILVEACGVWRVKCLRKSRNIRREMKLKRYQAWLDHQQQLESQASIPGQQLEFRRQSTTQRGVSDISDVSSKNDMESPQEAIASNTNHNHVIITCPSVIRRFVPKCILNIFRTNDAKKVARRYDILAATLHASRAWLGYLLMLAVMSYAVEFLISAVFGMVLGRYYFVDSGDGSGAAQGINGGAIGVGGNIGGMGLGGGGIGPASNGPEQHMTLHMTDMQNNNNDATWGGNDPCCGLDDDDDDNNKNPLLTPLIGSNTGMTRRSGQQTDIL